MIAWAREGLNLIIHSTDSLLFAAALGADLAALKGALADIPAPGQQPVEGGALSRTASP